MRARDITYDLPRAWELGLDRREYRYLLGAIWEAMARTTGSVQVGRVDKKFDDRARPDFCGPSWEVAIQPGVNGYAFGPRDVSALTGLMVRLAENEDRRQAMGEASANLIDAWSPDVFAANLIELAEMVKRSPRPQTGWVDRLPLRLMLNRRPWATR